MRIVFLKWKDPLVVGRDDYSSESLEDQSLTDILDAAQSAKPLHTGGSFVGGPFGIIPTAPHNAPSELYNLWVLHTDHHISHTVTDQITGVPGVELFRPWTPYRAWFGVGKLFNHEEVFQQVRKAVGATG